MEARSAPKNTETSKVIKKSLLFAGIGTDNSTYRIEMKLDETVPRSRDICVVTCDESVQEIDFNGY